MILDLSDSDLGVFVAPLRPLAREFSAAVGPGTGALLTRLRRVRSVERTTAHKFQCTLRGSVAYLGFQGTLGPALLERVLTGNPGWESPILLSELGAHLLEPLLEEWLAVGLGEPVRVGPSRGTMPEDGDFLEATFEVQVDGVQSECLLWLPRSLWPVAAPERTPSALPSWLGRRSLSVDTVVGHAHLTLEQLQEIRPGDLVALDHDPGDPWRVCVSRRVVAGAHPCATEEGLLALLLTELEEEFL